jgi:hypothetical protein
VVANLREVRLQLALFHAKRTTRAVDLQERAGLHRIFGAERDHVMFASGAWEHKDEMLIR